jgi:hypothetical protein
MKELLAKKNSEARANRMKKSASKKMALLSHE